MAHLPASQSQTGGPLGNPRGGLTRGNARSDGENTAAAQDYLTFAIDQQVYGIDILSVREIRAWTDVTNLPNTPEYVRGIINLRGTIVPIYDLRVRLGGGVTKPTRMHVVIVVVAANGTFGLLVDSVSDILSIVDRDLQTVPETDAASDYRFLSAIVARDERMVSIIDLDRLVSGQAAMQMQQIADQQPAATLAAN
ncbi:chemotaxis protein CheW [Ferrovibrio sp.]|uniref:chemotaxis protein CheW n=1 Tax=Ferrovibrio sp. TaxID=1917215 RepID=UPI0025B8EE78|nr:chemotaxis protein CheW [Ferrovibrio sp.]MBX3454717.1 purine-binding chemotaxis protein CheW [Ferrovibrio sp.]